VRRYGPIAAILAAVPLLAFGPAERIAPTHWALLVGISDYINFDDVEGGDLPGAEGDARFMRNTLVSHSGFPEENVRMLLNGEATQAAIKAGITEWLATNARPGDNVTIFFAGHGSQVWDENGDEDDGLDETLAPADVLPDSPAMDITDDMFGEWLAELPTDNVVVILDNCNSGTGTRSAMPFSQSRRLGREASALPKPESVSRRALPGQEDKTGFDAGEAHVLEFAAAQPSQAAVDAYFPATDGSEAFHGGAFTTFLVREIWKAPRDISYEELFERVSEALKRNRFQQNPHLSEDVALKSAPLFFVEGASMGPATASLPVRSVLGAKAELEGGMALGITSGSVFKTEGGAILQVESAGETSLTTRIMEGSPKQGENATLAGYRYTTAPLRVNVAGIDTESVDALTAHLGQGPGVELVNDADAFSHLIVRRRGNELRVLGADGFVRHDAMGVGVAGATELATKLRQEAAAKRLADMENPAQPFGVRIRLEDGKTDFGIGETVSFHATSDRDGYLTLVDLGTDGNVVMLFPNEHQPAMRIKAGETLSFPTAEMGFELQIFPPIGRGMVRAFVTPEPLDLPLVGEYTEGDERFAGAIAEAVQRAAGMVGGAVRLDTWATASLVYDIHN
jgi:hypothetical protein